MNENTWNELLDEFRMLGGTAENICLKNGAFGRGLFPADPSKCVAIRVPDNLLVKSGDMIFRDGRALVGPNANIGDRERTWLDAYQEQVSWGGGGRTEIERLFAIAQELPAEIRNKLFNRFRCGPWFGPPTEEAIQQRFLSARHITYRRDAVIMPIIECANHGEGATYGTTDGVSLNGHFSGEALVKYSDLDAFGFFKSWGFAVGCPSALSIALKGYIQSKPLWIARRELSAGTTQSIWVPEMMSEDGHPMLSYLLLNHAQYPRLAKMIFFQLMQDAGYSGFEACFHQILQANRAHFAGLLQTLEGLDFPMADMLRKMAGYQLQALSFSQDFQG